MRYNQGEATQLSNITKVENNRALAETQSDCTTLWIKSLPQKSLESNSEFRRVPFSVVRLLRTSVGRSSNLAFGSWGRIHERNNKTKAEARNGQSGKEFQVEEEADLQAQR